ncbi:TPA: UDP-3-O-(3-hydroxymyristoyl)glucosamine N-acyltransferase [Legionella pneumophila subsp. pneumophila]|nr:UDP-3-O-(3-hydroxymyristoyl)glucosamine N-acyltransferase [Legionella pneumophila subsp. pneumophila]HAT9212565.1 UDP-3-O-(3-hydroxymyristoyl)glucosamine N-acyltransferase [Legionella pneumophila subsp. pneumophila]HAT9242731.1 UDP-3-O-(3-hydroxymyristoyl)glucosamine N-acyltransferase [Legionella pneumophila subsp. pneumophila]HAT9254545.1 UDP-3-O-(3-hydroxymyristoyl)glucosamine N-acyltransferase [Legionella pneumophila subsp. pneumophila]HAT9258120.1 UDP-3-O-(3-hydroxymyristoyl)glucosamine 
MCMSNYQFTKPAGPFRLFELAKISGATLYEGKGETFTVSGLAKLSEATSNDLVMLHQKKYVKELKHTAARVCIIGPDYVKYAPDSMYLLVHPNPYKAFALIAQAFYPSEKPPGFIATSAMIESSAIIGVDCFIAHGAYIGNQVKIGNRCKIGVNTYIGDTVTIGDDCLIEDNVSIRHAVIGNNVVIYSGARIGKDGFGFASDANGHYKIPHAGGVIIGNDVEIGANTCIDRGSLDNTVIEDWCRLDNLVQIGHNVKIGKGSVLVAQVGIAGSTELGEHVTLAGQVGVIGHLKIGKGATVLASGKVYKNVKSGDRVGGHPAVSISDWQKQIRFLKTAIKPKKSPKS